MKDDRCKKYTMTHNSMSGHDTNPRIQCSKELGHKGNHIFLINEYDYSSSQFTGGFIKYSYKLPRSFN